MLYTADQLIEDFRSDVFDRADVDDAGNARDTLWSDVDVLRYLNSAAARWASDTLALRRLFTANITAGNPLVSFPLDEMLDVITASFVYDANSRPRKLDPFDIDEGVCTCDYGTFIHTVPDLAAEGTPTHFTRDYDNRYIRLWRVPQQDGVLTVHAHALPATIYAGAPLPFTAPADRDLVLMWMKKMAYEKQDADTFDLSRAKEFEQEYRRTMPYRKSEIDRLRRDGGIMRPRC